MYIKIVAVGQQKTRAAKRLVLSPQQQKFVWPAPVPRTLSSLHLCIQYQEDLAIQHTPYKQLHTQIPEPKQNTELYEVDQLGADICLKKGGGNTWAVRSRDIKMKYAFCGLCRHFEQIASLRKISSQRGHFSDE